MENTDSQTSNNENSSFQGGQGVDNRGYGGPRRRFGSPRPFRPVPVRVGEEYDVKIESMSKRGDSGVARVQGLVIFVAGTKVGDSAKIRITKVGRGYATAELVGEAGATNQSMPESPSPEATQDASSEGSAGMGGQEATEDQGFREEDTQ